MRTFHREGFVKAGIVWATASFIVIAPWLIGIDVLYILITGVQTYLRFIVAMLLVAVIALLKIAIVRGGSPLIEKMFELGRNSLPLATILFLAKPSTSFFPSNPTRTIVAVTILALGGALFRGPKSVRIFKEIVSFSRSD